MGFPTTKYTLHERRLRRTATTTETGGLLSQDIGVSGGESPIQRKMGVYKGRTRQAVVPFGVDGWKIDDLFGAGALGPIPWRKARNRIKIYLHRCYAAPSNPRSETPLNGRQMNQDDCELYGTSGFSSSLGVIQEGIIVSQWRVYGIVMAERWVSRLQREKREGET
ncbi:uncharacterized protein BO87DRAFT_419494 [Aspergillus neoniger CBS 115656]|uniref:Uncharacterized protein n=1 Tax=Aspergillus neoniger (strain CBS 115656) TaxID=1448310 RepID=A0A318Y848_ASPNB|nr:hypothetical protein BO87DRAFT_419494 [Aspergillus neoniger CBS 115656]PYH29717.1 hypothetical protein BO87DRAFT_419494 [Aspergillus neoniger CBS 115656]